MWRLEARKENSVNKNRKFSYFYENYELSISRAQNIKKKHMARIEKLQDEVKQRGKKQLKSRPLNTPALLVGV